MTEREVIKLVLDGEAPPYVPWSFSFTKEAEDKLRGRLEDFDPVRTCRNHLLGLGSDYGFFTDIGSGRVKDVFGVVWDRSVDRDIGVVENCVLPEPDLKRYEFPDPLAPVYFESIPGLIGKYPGLFRVFRIGFSLFERAWTLRGMENLMMDFYDNPGFVRELLKKIADYNIAQVKEAMKYDIDGVYFGDDWGQQRGLLMGPGIWREFLKPELERMYGAVREAGKYVFIHSCGDVDELFDDLIDIGVSCFNPFQPEVMDVEGLMERYRGLLSFHGGLSTQRILPYGSPGEVRMETRRLLEKGKGGSFILSPAHSVEGDVPVENILAFMDEAMEQDGWKAQQVKCGKAAREEAGFKKCPAPEN